MKPISRRNFTKALLLGSVGGAALTANVAYATLDKESMKAQLARIIITIAALTVVVRSFIIWSDGGLRGMQFDAETEWEPAEKLNLGKVPILGQILSKPLREQFANAQLVGSIYLIGSTLILVPLLVLATVSTLWLTHADKVWKPTKRLTKIKTKNNLSLETILAAQLVGRAALASGILLLILGSSVFNDFEFREKAPA